MTTKIVTLISELDFYIKASEELQASGEMSCQPILKDYIATTITKLQLALSWLKEASDNIELQVYNKTTKSPEEILPSWKGLSFLNKLDFIVSSLKKLKVKLRDLLSQASRLNDETWSNYNQSKQAYNEHPNPVDKEILDELYNQMDIQLINIEQEVNHAIKDTTEARFFLEYIIEKY